jgi:hypothetical protein
MLKAPSRAPSASKLPQCKAVSVMELLWLAAAFVMLMAGILAATAE